MPASRPATPQPSLASVCVLDESGACSVCGDTALVGEVLEVPGRSVARVRLSDGVREVNTDLLEGVKAGERVVVHLGFAIARVREPAREREPAGERLVAPA